MKVLISSLEEENFETEIEVGELSYDTEKLHFWMRLVMGDDWFQRVTSTFDFAPKIVRFSDRMCFIVCGKNKECEQLTEWLKYAEEKVREGYRTMRG